MIIGVLEYGEVRIFDDITHVMREWGPYPADVESGVITFYDADGVWLEPTDASEPFQLSRNENPDETVDSIALALFEAATLIPNAYFSSLDELRTKFPLEE